VGNLLFHTSSYWAYLTMTSLIGFITVIWLMVLVVAAFLVTLAPSVHLLFKGGERSNWAIVSLIQGVIAIGLVLLFILGLSKLKGFYAIRKLHL
jgi:hypothetical protein